MDVTLSKAVMAYKQAAKQGGQGGIGNEKLAVASGSNIASPPHSGISDVKGISGIQSDIGVEKVRGPAFDDLVATGLEKARATGYTSEATSTEAIADKAELHELVTAVSNAELTLNTVVALRDRIISAYQDLIKMPI